MPTIRIETEVFEALKLLAEPFVDTPSAVIRRLLVEKNLLEPAPAAKKTTPAGTNTRVRLALTPQNAYERYLLVSLHGDFGGRGDKRSVTRAVIERMVAQDLIGPAELELVATGETRAENTITWARNALKNRGLLSRASRRGIWELTEQGRAAAAAFDPPQP